MIINVIGLGYVGLPLALQAASKGVKVFGTDKNQMLVEKLNKKESLLKDDFIDSLINEVEIAASEKVAKADTYIVCVPTPVNDEKEPDLSYVAGCCRRDCRG